MVVVVGGCVVVVVVGECVVVVVVGGCVVVVVVVVVFTDLMQNIKNANITIKSWYKIHKRTVSYDDITNTSSTSRHLYPSIHPSINSFMHPFNYPTKHLTSYSKTNQPFYICINSSTSPTIDPFMHPSIQSSINSFMHACICHQLR